MKHKKYLGPGGGSALGKRGGNPIVDMKPKIYRAPRPDSIPGTGGGKTMSVTKPQRSPGTNALIPKNTPDVPNSPKGGKAGIYATFAVGIGAGIYTFYKTRDPSASIKAVIDSVNPIGNTIDAVRNGNNIPLAVVKDVYEGTGARIIVSGAAYVGEKYEESFYKTFSLRGLMGQIY